MRILKPSFVAWTFYRLAHPIYIASELCFSTFPSISEIILFIKHGWHLENFAEFSFFWGKSRWLANTRTPYKKKLIYSDLWSLKFFLLLSLWGDTHSRRTFSSVCHGTKTPNSQTRNPKHPERNQMCSLRGLCVCSTPSISRSVSSSSICPLMWSHSSFSG